MIVPWIDDFDDSRCRYNYEMDICRVVTDTLSAQPGCWIDATKKDLYSVS